VERRSILAAITRSHPSPFGRTTGKGLLTAEAVTLATALVNRKLTADQMIDDGFNKHNFNHKDGLPTWFLDDEGKFYKPNLPVTKEAIQALRAKQRALDARPIKKVAEAKARKKFKAAARMDKARRKMDGLTDAPDMSERDKAQQMQKLLGKAAGKPKKKEVAVVVAKGVNRGVKGRPKGVKGRYKIVDPRMREWMTMVCVGWSDPCVLIVQSCVLISSRQRGSCTQENRETRQEAKALVVSCSFVRSPSPGSWYPVDLWSLVLRVCLFVDVGQVVYRLL
jgi:hypothetical protein